MAKNVGDVMTERPRCATLDTPLQEVARIMETEDVGVVPLLEGERLVGLVTDRDIVVRALAGAEEDPRNLPAQAAASQDLVGLRPDQDLDDALRVMAQSQVRRLPVVDDDDRLLGIVALADVARETKEKAAGELLEALSQPSRTPRL
jgi:CBS domain-containing protein